MKLVQIRKLLLEGGNAAEKLIPQLQPSSDKPLTYTKISQKDLGTVFDTTVAEILDVLKKNKLISPKYQPKYSLGSTRLAADIAGKPVSRLSHEDPSIVAKATMAKQDFGDLDIDIELLPNKTMKDVVAVLSKMDPTRIAVKDAGKEANIAAKIGDKVIQIDVVDVAGNRQNWEFDQSSSYADTAENVKGFTHKVFLACIVQTLPFDQDDKLKLAEIIKNHPEIQKWTSKGYRLVNMGRFLLGPKGLRIVVDMEKDGVKGRKTLDLEDKQRVSSEDLDKLAQVILQDNSVKKEDMFSAVRMAQFMKNKHPDRVQPIWNMFVEKTKFAITDGRISEKDAANAFQVLGTQLGVPSADIQKAIRG
jgi:hypothetical protein